MRLLRLLRGKPKNPVSFGGGSGETKEEAVVITAPSETLGVRAEYVYVHVQCGRGWKLMRQSILESPDGKHYDLLTVSLKDATVREFYFDISSFFGK